MKTTIIDILNKIANGEEVPRVIKYNNMFYEFDKEHLDYHSSGFRLFGNELEESYELIEHLKDKVEILETTITYNANQLCGGGSDKIEKLHTINNIIGATDLAALRSMQWENNQKFFRKINEIIDRINES